MHREQIELRYSDSDQMGVVYHANYFSFFEIGRTKLLASFGIDYYEIEQRGYVFPVREVDCTYFKSIVLGETIFCDTTITELSKVKIAFEHVLINDQGEVKAKGHTAIVSVKKDGFTIAKMDQHLPDVYAIKHQI
ncbi:acyl-CoA thioesterase [Candidatus Xianfuyuplasma coldseepsis]|uniref:Acyl-CoA thioesterase n=1 Tax=Candidatus Xianfuyuplasma coldseepsis TaxID=2782163 RepID=A0A7L7KRH6_9MOLU|nr:thioesterase family protein [Xianfuyuplasma coldseepsis]QMS84806.1 acyl-CoA thioesterase [Xianfuyuplasma coldseepsis]